MTKLLWSPYNKPQKIFGALTSHDLCPVNLPVFLVCLGAHLCQVHQVVLGNLERDPELYPMLTGWVQVGQEVPEALVDRGDPGEEKDFNFFSPPRSELHYIELSHLFHSYFDEYSVTVQVFKSRAQGICSIL